MMLMLLAAGEKFDMTFHDRYTPFAPEQAMDFHIRIRNVKDGSYTVRETVVSRKSGSAFDQWLRMGGMEVQGADELECLLAHSKPHVTKYRTEVKNHTLEIDAMLDMLEVRLIELIPETV